MALRSRKKQDDKEGNDSLIQIMTISLFIILLAFFILLNSIAKIDENKTRRVVSSIVENFGGKMPIRTGGEQSEEVFTDGVSPLDLADLTSGEVAEMKDIQVKATRKRTTLTLPEDLLFSRYGTRIQRRGTPVLDKLADIIKANPVPVDITGHTDNVPLSQNVGITSRELTALRSVNVMEYLVTKGNVPAGQLTAYGWGKEKPAAPNTTSRTRVLNNRIDVTFTHDKSFDKPNGFFIFKDFFFNVKDK